MAVDFDAVSSGTVNASVSQTLTVSHTVGGSSNRAIYVGTYLRNIEGPMVSVTYGGNALTAIASLNLYAQATVQVWRLLAPSTGTANIVATQTGFQRLALIGISLSDVNQTTPEATIASNAGTLSQAATVGTDGLLLSFAGVEDYDLPTPPQFTATGTGQTERADVGVSYIYLAGSTQTGSGSVTASYTFGQANDQRGIIAVPVNTVGGGGGGSNIFGRLKRRR